MNAHSMLAAAEEFCKNHKHPFREAAFALEAAIADDIAAHFASEIVAFGFHLPVGDTEFVLHAAFETVKVTEEVLKATLALD